MFFIVYLSILLYIYLLMLDPWTKPFERIFYRSINNKIY